MLYLYSSNNRKVYKWTKVTYFMVVDFIGLGTKAGSEVVKTLDIAQRFDKNRRSVERCGTTNLFRIGQGESLESLAEESAKEAIKQAGISENEINGIYSSICCPTTQYLIPGLARVLGKRLGVSGIPMINLSMGCTGGIHAIQTAYNQLRLDALEGRTGNALVVVGGHISRALDPQSWDTAGVFSDGVATIVLSSVKKGEYSLKAVKSVNLEGDIMSMNIQNPSEETPERRATFRMDGGKVFDFAYRETYPAMLKMLGLDKFPDDAYLIPHQASGVVLKYLQKESKLKQNQIYTGGIGRFGNMTGASVLFGLDDVLKRNLASERDIVLGGFGAELSVGVAYLSRK